jgi:ubiquinone/menaquinone biosynthesis C-methylase UbiE
VTWTQAPADRIPVAESLFDRILCFSAWPHFENQQAVIREFRRIVRPNGLVHVFHFISRDEVNHIHQTAHPSVHADLLAPAGEVASLFESDGFTVLETADDARHYSLTVQKK